MVWPFGKYLAHAHLSDSKETKKKQGIMLHFGAAVTCHGSPLPNSVKYESEMKCCIKQYC